MPRPASAVVTSSLRAKALRIAVGHFPVVVPKPRRSVTAFDGPVACVDRRGSTPAQSYDGRDAGGLASLLSEVTRLCPPWIGCSCWALGIGLAFLLGIGTRRAALARASSCWASCTLRSPVGVGLP